MNDASKIRLVVVGQIQVSLHRIVSLISLQVQYASAMIQINVL